MAAVIAAPHRFAPARLATALLASLGVLVLVLMMHSLASARFAAPAPTGSVAAAAIQPALDRPTEVSGTLRPAACETRPAPVSGTATDCVAAPSLVPVVDAIPSVAPWNSEPLRYRAPIDPDGLARPEPSPILLSVSRT